jgi:DNA-binding NarL/FixJ family response regulator
MSRFRIALVDGDDAIRAGLRLLLDSQPDMQVVYEESVAANLLETLPDLLVDTVVINHRLQGIDGVTLTKRLVELIAGSQDRVPAFIVTGSFYTYELLIAAMRAGASDVITQDSPAGDLLDAIRNSRRTMAEVDLSKFAKFIDSNNFKPEPDASYLLKLANLSEGEKDVLEQFSKVRSIDQISTALNLPRHEVREHLENILASFGCATIEQLYLITRDSSANA